MIRYPTHRFGEITIIITVVVALTGACLTGVARSRAMAYPGSSGGGVVNLDIPGIIEQSRICIEHLAAWVGGLKGNADADTVAEFKVRLSKLDAHLSEVVGAMDSVLTAKPESASAAADAAESAIGTALSAASEDLVAINSLETNHVDQTLVKKNYALVTNLQLTLRATGTLISKTKIDVRNTAALRTQRTAFAKVRDRIDALNKRLQVSHSVLDRARQRIAQQERQPHPYMSEFNR